MILVSQWKMFEKANVEGWKSLIPFYREYCFCKIVMGSGWLFLLNLVPCVNLIFHIILSINTAKAYSKGIGFGILTIFFAPIMYMILGFSVTKYVGPQK